MPPVTSDQLTALEPYIAGAKPDDRGEVDIYCPMHPDAKRSASLNLQKGVWYCHAGCGGSSVRQLVLAADEWVSAEGRVQMARPSAPAHNGPYALPRIKDIDHWHRRLRRESKVHRRLRRRGLRMGIMRKAQIGWDGRYYKIPIFSPERELWNVRNYDPDATNGRSKIWNTRGMGAARLYPISVLESLPLGGSVLFCEGEWDTLLALQHGTTAVTRTDGAGKPWHDEWTEYFAGTKVFVCNDADRAGARSDFVVADELNDVAEIYQCHLPFRSKEQGGYDLTDYLLMFKSNKRDYMLADLIASATRRS